jgi:5-methyltetrahydropteroyltriglutamate--homocysteine methyltransferase
MTHATSALDHSRVDQVGSLIRPRWLQALYARHSEGRVTDAELRQAQDQAIREVIAQQETYNYPIVTDGEFRRLNFMDSFAGAVSGFAAERTSLRSMRERVAGQKTGQRFDPAHNPDGPPLFYRSGVRERLRLERHLLLEEYQFSLTVASRPVKLTLIGPDRILQRFDAEVSRYVYHGVDDFAHDVVAIERRMIGEVVTTGCRYIQIDAPSYTAYVDAPSLEAMRARGEDPLVNLERSIAADNAVVADFPDVTFGMHLCRGNEGGRWHREGSYDAIAERLFNSVAHQRLLLEYDTERAGGFEPLRFVPTGKIAVLGLVSTKTPRLETVDELQRRVEAASAFLPLEQLALSPQCGFSSDILGGPLTEDDQWRKLEVIQEAAARIWGST